MFSFKLPWLITVVLIGGTLIMNGTTDAEAKKPAAPVKLIPREILFGNPEKASPRLSPDGKRIAYLAPVNNVLNVWVKTIGKEDDQPVTKDTYRGIRTFFWAYDNQHILYLQDVGGNENWRVYGIDMNTLEQKDYTPYEEVQARVIEHSKDYPHELLLGMNKENPQVHDVYHLDLRTGELKQVAKNPGTFSSWVIDAHLQVRGATESREDGGMDLLVRDSTQGEWKKVISWSFEDSLNSGPVDFTKDGKSLYIEDSRNFNTTRLGKLNLETGKVDYLAQDAHYDLSGIMMNPDTRDIQAVSFLRARNEWEVLDSSIKKDFDVLKKVNPGDFSIVSRDTADKTWLVAYIEDKAPVSWYAYDRESHQTTFLYYSKKDLTQYSLTAMEPVSFKSRDGLTIHGYMTFPAGVPRKNLPMVLNVHGGPWARDSWGYDPEAQWVANRGYLCLQVNFRGSTGYGKDFLNAGDKQWGAKMHDDLIDAVNWAVEKGYANPKKVAIYGGSYGGYAALAGATFTPDTFNCAVDIVGPSNLITLIKTVPPYWSTFLANMKRRVGDPDTEEEFLKSRSPLFSVDRIKCPILIGQGANDPRVKQAESEQIVEAMKKKNIPYEYVLFPDEGHGFARPENRLKFYAIAEKFLSKHLGGRYQD